MSILALAVILLLIILGVVCARRYLRGKHAAQTGPDSPKHAAQTGPGHTDIASRLPAPPPEGQLNVTPQHADPQIPDRVGNANKPAVYINQPNNLDEEPDPYYSVVREITPRLWTPADIPLPEPTGVDESYLDRR